MSQISITASAASAACGEITQAQTSFLVKTRTHPTSLQTHADQHPWKLGGLAEIPDNAVDSGATKVKQLHLHDAIHSI